MAKIENTLPPITTSTGGGTSIHNDLSGLNVGNYIHLTALEKIKFDNLPNSFAPTDAEKNVNADWNSNSGDSQILNKPSTFTPSTHTHIEADITDLDKYTQSETNTLLNNKVDKVTGKSLIDDAEITRLATVTNFDNSGNITALGNKVDKILGKGLSTEDYTTTEKSKLAGIQAGAEVNINADWNATSGDAQILNKPTIPSIAGLATETYVDSKISNTITNGVTDKAPSEDVVFDALALKVDKTDLIIKSLNSDIIMSSSTQLNTNLSFPIGTNEIWVVEFNLSGGCSSSGGTRFQINSPTGSTGAGHVVCASTQASIGVNSPAVAQAPGSTQQPITIYMTIRNSTTAGNVTLSFASNSNGQQSQVRANSYMIANKSILV